MSGFHNFKSGKRLKGVWISQFQIKEEIEGCLDFLKYAYGTLDFSFDLKLSTRPEKFLGEIAVWDNAEKVMLSFMCTLEDCTIWKE